MITRTQTTLDPELQRRARRRALECGISFAEYVRRLIVRDIAGEKSRLVGESTSGGCRTRLKR